MLRLDRERRDYNLIYLFFVLILFYLLLLSKSLKRDAVIRYSMDNMTVRKVFVFAIAMIAGLSLASYLPIFGDSAIGVGASAGLICLITNVALSTILRIR